MADEMVRRAQRFINLTYSHLDGIPQLEEDGVTGWTTMYALTRALQHELGITALSNSFGPATLAALEARWLVIADQGVPANIVRIVQSGLYCKGYDGGNISGVYDERTDAGVTALKENMGVDAKYPRGVTPKVFKALLTMDAYVVISGGSVEVRAVQQWMNDRYVNRRNFFIIPCDGHFSRDVQKALMLAIQYEIGMSDDVANGVFGPGTQAGLRSNTISEGSTGVWVQLFSSAMLFNRRGVSFTSAFTSGLAAAVRAFQDFVKLPITGKGDFQTWASLLVSTGDATRRGTALDCVTEITTARARALHGAGYRIVGRYLCNVAGTTLNKMIQPWELETIVLNGLRIFPIYQTYGGERAYFNGHQGTVDALDAINWARYHGFKSGARIYFAVDYDAIDADVTSNIIPHFRAVKSIIDEHSGYQVGIYGPRNVCSRVAAEGLTSASFVCDMSTGFSGNLGYPLPADWAFDQIATITVGSGDGRIEIDNNIASGRDGGHNSFSPDRADDLVDVDCPTSRHAALLADVRAYLVSIDIGEESNGGLTHVNSTGRAFEILMKFDKLITSLSQRLRMRKALIQVPVIWETRHLTNEDLLVDDVVRAHHQHGTPGPADCSTGLGQIFASTAINARNYCISQGLLNGARLDPGNDDHLGQIWLKLNEDPIYNVNAVPLVHILHASLVSIPRPTLGYSEENTRKLLVRYQGDNDSAEREGAKRLGLYRVFEAHNAALRTP